MRCYLITGNCGSQGLKDFMNESKLMDLLNSSDYVPTYEDKDGDWMLVGDVPWEYVYILHSFRSSPLSLHYTKAMHLRLYPHKEFLNNLINFLHYFFTSLFQLYLLFIQTTLCALRKRYMFPILLVRLFSSNSKPTILAYSFPSTRLYVTNTHTHEFIYIYA